MILMVFLAASLFSVSPTHAAELSSSRNRDHRAERVREHRSALSLEALGRGLLYTVNYDKLAFGPFALGVGISYVPLQTTKLVSVPVYTTLYLNSASSSRVYLTAGATFFKGRNSGDPLRLFDGTDQAMAFSSSSQIWMISNAGLGYEYRDDSGFLLRLTPYFLFFGKDSTVIDAKGDRLFMQAWVGMSAGYSF